MTNKLRKYLSFLLVFALVLSAAPFAFAAENAPDAAQAETAEASPPETVSEVPPGDEPGMEEPSADDYGVMAAAATGGVLLFNKASPNYTVVLKNQVTVKYQLNGSGAAKTAYVKNMGWHFARINNVAYEDDTLYCIEPCKDFAASTSGNYVATDVPISGSGSSQGEATWFALPDSYRSAISLILQYSGQMWNRSVSVTNTAMASNPNVPLRTATQMLIYEIVTGLRDADSFQLRDSNGYTSGDVFYNAGCASLSGFAERYNALVSSVQSVSACAASKRNS